LTYNPISGIFTRKYKIGCKGVIGERVGCIDKVSGYRVIRLDNILYKANRLAYLYMTGILPDLVDHVDTDRSSDKWDNLREATKSQNAMNSKKRLDNTTGIKGISWESRETFKGYQARIMLNQVSKTKRFSISKFNNSKEQAVQAAITWIQSLRQELHGEFAHNG